MLTPFEKMKQAKELRENYKRRDQNLETTLSEPEMTEKNCSVLKMKGEDSGDCWKVRDYLEDKLTRMGVPVYSFQRWQTTVQTNGSLMTRHGEISINRM